MIVTLLLYPIVLLTGGGTAMAFSPSPIISTGRTAHLVSSQSAVGEKQLSYLHNQSGKGSPMISTTSLQGTARPVSFVRSLNKRMRTMVQQKVHVKQLSLQKLKKFIITFCFALSVLFGSVPMKSSMIVPPSHASTTTTTLVSATTATKQKLTYEDKLTQKYLGKHMFNSDTAETPFESAYKEAALDEISELEPFEEAIDGMDITSTGSDTKGIKKKKTSAVPKKVKRFGGLFSALYEWNKPLTQILVKRFGMDRSKATSVALGGQILTGILGGLFTLQFILSMVKLVMFKQEGERYGGRDYTAIEKDEDDEDFDPDYDDDDDDFDDDDE